MEMNPQDDGMLERAKELRRRLEVHIKHDGPCSDNMIAEFGRAVRKEALEEADRICGIYTKTCYAQRDIRTLLERGK